MKLNTLEDLLLQQVKDLYYAEKQLTKAIPKMAKAAQSVELKSALEDHLKETREHVSRLEEVFGLMGVAAKPQRCAAMDGIIEEGSEMIDADGDPDVIDAGLIAAAQRVEHYEIAGYGCARAFAQRLGMTEVVELLTSTLEEEGAADKTLTQLAESEVNDSAANGSGQQDGETESAATPRRKTRRGSASNGRPSAANKTRGRTRAGVR